LSYRKVLRKFEKDKYHNNQRGSLMSWATTMAAKAKVKSALQAGEYLKVLELGEDVLARNPWDNDAQMYMAKAAEELGALKLAIWIVKEVWESNRQSADVHRELALLYEKKGDLPRAIEYWKVVMKLDADDLEAPRRVQDLAARHTLERGQYE